ncbi:hypothetical protein K523DRAFT_359026 [Schizophyllum commune Tattone D]|nr:hypothetical protein K523DRAFT_359026 [Schizophyllum commune Tattone D]
MQSLQRAVKYRKTSILMPTHAQRLDFAGNRRKLPPWAPRKWGARPQLPVHFLGSKRPIF